MNNNAKKTDTPEATGSFKERLQNAWENVCEYTEDLFAKHRSGGQTQHDEDLFVDKKRRRPFPLAVLFTTLKLSVLLIILAGCVGVGLVTGIAKAYIDTTAELDVSQLTKSDLTSYIYDKDGNLITTYAGMEYRDWVNIEEIPDMLKNALISIEDVRFYKHGGVDYKRLFSAVVNTLRNSDTHGGSTLTQQLIKNKILSNEQSYKRKIQEAYLALEVENLISKDEILEAYMNDVYLGGSNYGVKTAAKDYFGKELSALTVRECAMLAGMVQKPYETNPRSNVYSRTLNENRILTLESAYSSGSITERQYKYSLDNNNCMYITDKRTNTVLLAMYKGGYITKDQYDNALNDTVTILENSEQTQIYDMPYFVEYGISDVVTHLLESRELPDTKANRTAVENELRTGGYSIYLTVDTEMQHIVQDTLANWTDYPELANATAAVKVETNSDGTLIETAEPQAAAVVFDYHTGELRAIVGGRTSPTVRKGWNRAYQSSTQVGSAIKPLAVYGPALDLGMSPASVVLNLPYKITGWDTETGYPSIGSEKYIGPITMRRGLTSSLNVSAARTLMEYVTIPKSYEYLVNLGVDESRINATGAGLALGTSGITPIEMAAAYGAIGNEGTYIEPLSFTRVVDSNGKVLLDSNKIRETRQVFKTTTAYLLVDMMEDVVSSGTGTKAQIKGMTVAGKTGTNADYQSVYFAGITPYYSAAVWIGHDDYNQKLKKGSSGGTYAAPLWQAFMEKIHDGMSDKPIIDGSPAEMGLVKRTVCTISGKLATDACAADSAGHTPVTDWFDKDNVPNEYCDMHVSATICGVSGQPASVYCPSESLIYSESVVLISSDSIYGAIDQTLVKQYIPNAVFTDITAEEYSQSSYSSSSLCSVHSPYGYAGSNNYELSALQDTANDLISEVNAYLNVVQNLSSTNRSTLLNGLSSVESYMYGNSITSLSSAIEQLQYNFNVIKADNPPPVSTDTATNTEG